MRTIEAMQYLKPGAIVPVDVQTTAILVNALQEALNASLAEQDMPKIGCVNHDCAKCKAEQPAPATELREQGPVANVVLREGLPTLLQDRNIKSTDQRLYTSPQPAQRTWVGLTDEEILIMSRYDLEYAALIGEVQRKLKEKNT